MDMRGTGKDAKDNILGTEKIGRLLVKFAVPGIISMVVNSLYNIIDQVFIGQGVGYLGNGATSIIFPMATFAMAFSLLFGDGAAAMLSLKLGEHKKDEAAKGTLAGITGFTIGGILVAAVYLAFFTPLCRLFGATDDILPYAVDYGRIITYGLPFCAICAGGSSLIRADGNPRFNMVGLFTGTIINLVCDPLFIFVFNWGVKGAAFATILGQFANALLNVYYFAHKMNNVELSVSLWKQSFGFIPKVARLGVSSFITQMALVVAIAVRNNVLNQYGQLSKYGPDIPIAALGITMKTFSIIMSIVIGLSAGAQPIFGYNYGSGRYGRVKQTFRLVAVISTVICSIAFLIAQIAPMAVIIIFGSESALYNEFAVKCMVIMKDLCRGNQHLGEERAEEALGFNAIACGFQGQRQWTDRWPDTDMAEAILNTSFDWEGARETFVTATENDSLNGATMLFEKLLTNRAQMFADVRTMWSGAAVKRVTGYDIEGHAREADGFIHLINSGACALDFCGKALDGQGMPVVKPFWEMNDADIEACLKATTWCASDKGYFRGGGYSSRFVTEAEMPVTMARLNLIKGQGPVMQLVEGWTVKLPAQVTDVLWKRTDYTWPCTWFTPRVGPKAPFRNAYEVMNAWGANHGAISFGHIGADLITLCSMLRIPVCMHNVPDTQIFRPAVWGAFGSDPEGQDYRACANYGPM